MGGLTNATMAEAVVAAVARPEIMERIRAAADAGGIPVGALVASKVRHLIDHGAEDIWLDLLGVMSGSPQPGAAAIERMMAHAFPDPVRVRIKRSGG
ncbi:MAG: hypothetical protein ABSC95_09900 [Acetobacteraceae bacterium]